MLPAQLCEVAVVVPCPDFGEILPPHAPCPAVVGFLSVPLHRPCRQRQDSARREGTASEVDGGGRGGQKDWFRKDGLRYVLNYFGFVHGVEASPMGGSGRGDLAFHVTGEGRTHPEKFRFFLEKLSKMFSPEV